MNPNTEMLHHLVLAALANKDAMPELIYFACSPVLESAPPCLPVDVTSPLFFACQAITVDDLKRRGIRAALIERYAQALFRLRREWYESGNPAKLESYSLEAYDAAQSWIDVNESILLSIVVLHKAIGSLAGTPPTFNATLPPASAFPQVTLSNWDQILLADLLSR